MLWDWLLNHASRETCAARSSRFLSLGNPRNLDSFSAHVVSGGAENLRRMSAGLRVLGLALDGAGMEPCSTAARPATVSVSVLLATVFDGLERAHGVSPCTAASAARATSPLSSKIGHG